jgi:hypothetical protein
MGTVRESGSTTEETGLFGYNKGVRTIELDAEDGSAKFGKTGAGQIIISPDEQNAHSVLKSGNYVAPVLDQSGNIITPGQGLEIDLTDPHITFGSGNFRVNADGQVAATGFVTTTKLASGDYYIPGVENFKIQSVTDTVQFETDADHKPSTNINKTIVCTGIYKDAATSNYTVALVNSNGTTLTTPYTSGGLTISLTKSGADTTITFAATAQTVITNATNEFFIKMTYIPQTSVETAISITKALYANLVIQGQDGQAGEQGPVGPAGKDGKDGTSVTVKGSYDTLAQLKAAHPSGNTLGDAYVIGLDLYVFTNAAGGGGSLDGD